jgi:hypothetical protein
MPVGGTKYSPTSCVFVIYVRLRNLKNLDIANSRDISNTLIDMVGAHPSLIPAPVGTKIYDNENWDGDEKFSNLYQQYCGCINFAALIRPT